MILDKSQEGFTLIEMMMVIVITAILSISFYNIASSTWNFFDFQQNKLNLKQQARIISVYLEQDIKRAEEVDVRDVDSDGEDELLLRFGIKGSNDRYDYRQYNVNNKKLARKIPAENYLDEGGNEIDGKTILSGDWPVEWGYNSYLTADSIDLEKLTANYFYSNSDNNLITYKFKLEQGDQLYHLINKIMPRGFDNNE